VPSDLTACKVWESVKLHAEAKRLTPGVSGEGDYLTRYIGARASSKRIRIYRKDQQDPWFDEAFGAVIRVELILREEYARGWWPLFDQDVQAAYRAAAGTIAEMMGVMIIPAGGLLVERERQPDYVEAGQELFQFIQQHGSRIAVWEAQGVDLGSLAALRCADASRDMRCRQRQFAARLTKAGPSEVVAYVERLMGAGEATGTASSERPVASRGAGAVASPGGYRAPGG
jgi:hypothetical protein